MDEWFWISVISLGLLASAYLAGKIIEQAKNYRDYDDWDEGP